jgi:hypothetical protein
MEEFAACSSVLLAAASAGTIATASLRFNAVCCRNFAFDYGQAWDKSRY